MKPYDLYPTTDNLIDTYRNDIIGRNADIFRFIEILDTVETGFSIALDGHWGSGKTFFVKQVKMVIDALNPFIDHSKMEHTDDIVTVRNRYYRNNPVDLQPQVCVYYDAWENDNDDDPILSLIYSILASVDSDFSFKDTNAIEIAASIMEVFSGRNWTQLVDSLKGKSPLDALKERKNIAELVDEFLNSLILEKGNRLVVFIDELDRCKPNYAVKLLERIKHYFNHDNITFVFSVNIDELQHTIKKYYGDEFDGCKYLDRFFDLRVTLPPPDLQGFFSSLNFNDSYHTFDIVCGIVIKAYHLELREIAKFLRIAKTAAYAPTHGHVQFPLSGGRGKQFSLSLISPIMIALKVQNTTRYTAFIEGRDNSPLLELVPQLKELGFPELLNNDETFDKRDTSKTVVTLEEKLKFVYEAIFVETYSDSVHRKEVGNMSFNAEIKNTLMKTVGLMSEYTKLDID